MATQTPKYPSPKDPGDDRGYGPSWRDVTNGLQELRRLTGFSYWTPAYPSSKDPNSPYDCLIWYVKCAFDRPWTDELNKYGPYGRFPNKDYKTVPALLCALIEREVTLYLQWKEPLKQGTLF